jgi:hypothetical protein
MIEQWFLDLDGVRSGPYQTPEVMSLIAEGEVLPHHRISTSLREQRWITILDWRLDQAKISKHVPSSPFSTSRSEVSTVEGLQEAPVEKQEVSPVQNTNVTPAPVPTPAAPNPPTPQPETPTASAPNANVPTESPRAPSSSEANVPIVPPQNLATPPLNKKPPPLTREEKEEDEVPEAFEQLRSELANPTGKPGALPLSKPQGKRDPMAEMFDMLQNTKQKKEAKQNQTTSSGISIEQDNGDAPKKKSGFGIGQTLAIGLGITLVGFALGQLFQQSAPPPVETAATAKAKPTPASAANTPAPAEPTEVIDRSTDKMTIRGVVKKEEVAPSGAPAVKANTRNSRLGSEIAPQTEKELEELRNLKKELQELKALKSNNNNAVDAAPEAESDTANGESGADPNANPNRGMDPNSMSTLDPNATPIQAPSDGNAPGNNPNNE